MSVVAELGVPPESFVLARAMADRPATVLELEQFVPTDAGATSFLWAEGGEAGAFRAAMADDPTVAAADLLDRTAGCRLFQVRWRGFDGTLVDGFPNGDEAVLRAVGRGGEWSVNVRFRDREALAGFQDYCETSGTEPDVRRLYEPRGPKLGRYDLTAPQRDAIVAALRMGYFAVPRRCTLRDVGAALGVSPNAASERLRRGEANLFRAALTVGGPARASAPG